MEPEKLENPNETDISGNPNHPSLDDFDSTCSTPYVSAPSSPGRGHSSSTVGCGGGGYFFSAPSSPMHFVLSSLAPPPRSAAEPSSFEFEFSARSGPTAAADELFLNGQIRPMKLSSHLQRPQMLAPLLDLDEEAAAEEEEVPSETAERGRELRTRSRSVHRRARSMSPMRNPSFRWREEEEEEEEEERQINGDPEEDQKAVEGPQPSDSASSSRSSSSGRNSKRWIFLKDLLYRSKSEGRGNAKEKFWTSISFSPSSKDRKPPPPPTPSPAAEKPKPPPAAAKKGGSTASASSSETGRRRRQSPSPHEIHYTANRAQAEEMRRKTYLPYRQGLLGCLGFSSRSYGAMHVGIAKTLNPVSSR
ncbi:hypothetical protein QJS04_geneDACA004538 [Acorus gramineus]|uniref:Calmodulin-binding protein n=1 Tax=Acorus gramineus TaxID=55184 RepID=A0AAV9BX08_ACOGR|nr:hypothetical protein QJS04_geneDACA004538 [Acorus gramineus]